MAGEPDTLQVTSSRELFGTSAYGDWIGRVSLIDDGSKWIATYRVAAQHSVDANAKICIRFSTDEGANWTAENVFTDTNPVTGAPFSKAGQTDINYPILCKAPNGDILLSASVGGTGAYFWRSTDGGATWSDEGVMGPYATDVLNFMIPVGSDIYAVCYASGYNCDLAKSSDNGATWALVNNVTTDADIINFNEFSIINPSGNNLLVALRYYDGGWPHFRKSTDLGASWSALYSTADIGIIQPPVIKLIDSRIYLVGRDNQGVDAERTIIAYSDDGGDTWIWGCHLESNNQSDCGYACFLERTDGSIYVLSYAGTTGAAKIYEYIITEI